MIKEVSGHQLKIGDKVKMNIAVLAQGDLDGVEITATGKNYWRYMNEHPDEVYTVIGIDLTVDSECIYKLDGFMGDNTWAADELIHLPDPGSPYEIIKNMTLDEMAKDLLPLIGQALKRGELTTEDMKEWLSGKLTIT